MNGKLVIKTSIDNETIGTKKVQNHKMKRKNNNKSKQNKIKQIKHTINSGSTRRR